MRSEKWRGKIENSRTDEETNYLLEPLKEITEKIKGAGIKKEVSNKLLESVIRIKEILTGIIKEINIRTDIDAEEYYREKEMDDLLLDLIDEKPKKYKNTIGKRRIGIGEAIKEVIADSLFQLLHSIEKTGEKMHEKTGEKIAGSLNKLETKLKKIKEKLKAKK